MKDKNKFRAKVQMIILSVILATFVITGIVYVVTLKTYVLDNKREARKTEESQMANQSAEKVPDETETPAKEQITKPAPEEKPIKDNAAEPETETAKEPTFKERNEVKYADEIASAYKTYISDTTYIAVMKNEINGNPYCVAHVIVNDPKQIKTIVTSERQYVNQLSDTNVLMATNASMLEGYTQFIDGLHICNYNIISKTATSNGTELAFDDTGNLNRLAKDISFEDLKQNHIQWTILSTEPVLIDNSKATEIPADIPTNTTCKTAIGMVSPGEYYFLTASDGDYISDVTYADIQKILLDKSCTFAQAMSTGVNVVMSMQGELINQPAVATGRPQYEYIVVYDAY